MTERDLLVLEVLMFLMRPPIAGVEEHQNELYGRVVKEFGKATEEVEGDHPLCSFSYSTIERR